MEKLQKRHGCFVAWLDEILTTIRLLRFHLHHTPCIRTTSAIFPPNNYTDSQYCFELKNYRNGWLRCIPKFKSRFDLNQSGIFV